MCQSTTYEQKLGYKDKFTFSNLSATLNPDHWSDRFGQSNSLVVANSDERGDV